MNRGKKIFVILFFGIILLTSTVIPFAFGQTTPEEEGCIVKQFKENAYAPFRIIQTGDPAIRNSVEDQHQDPNSRWHMDRAEFQDEGSPTTINFFTDSIDDWKWTVRSEYKTEATEPRPITIHYQSNNLEFQSETFYRTGFDFCIIYYVQVREAPHIFTEEEILETADKIQEENFAVVGTQINSLVKEVTATKNSNNVVNAIAVILVLVLILTNAMQSRGNKALKKGMNQERQLLAGERARTRISASQSRLDFEQFKKDSLHRIDNFIETANVRLNTVILDLSRSKEIKELIQEPEPKQEILGPTAIDRDNLIAEHQFEDTGKEDPLKLEQAKKFPHFFNLLHRKTKETVESAKQQIQKPKDTQEKNVEYYLKYYEEKLDGHESLVKEYALQSDAYGQTQSKDAYTRATALSLLSQNNKKFDPREEIE